MPSWSVRRHPWETARASFLLDVLEHAGGLRTSSGAPLSVLDVGSGDGYVARVLLSRAAARVCCWDLNFTDDDLATLARVHGLSPSRAPPDGAFDVALLLDVIEHVEDDLGLVRDVVSRVRPGGIVLVSVPAWPSLFSAHDVALRHFRRYTPAACRAVLGRAGLTVEQGGGLFHGLLLPRAAAVVAERARRPRVSSQGIGAWKGGDVVTGAILAALQLELRASRFWARRGIDVPGLSYFALCRVGAEARGNA
jgi:SAM-dependent methyltransferase